MKESKIGRNSPCPCGSGKKYKNCCLPLEGVVDHNAKPFEKYSQLIATVKVKLDQHYDTQIRKMRKPLQERFMRICTTPLPKEQESIFSDWLWFDMTDSEGTSFGAEYMRENGEFMEKPLQECLQALNSSYISLYEVVAMEGDNLRIKDMITAKEESVMLREPLELELIENRPLLLGRLAFLPQGAIFSGMVLMLKNDDGQGEFICQHMSYLHRLKPDQEIAALLKNYGEILFGTFEHASHKALLRLNDIRILRCGDNVSSPAFTLDQAHDFALAHTSGGIRWYDLQDAKGIARIGTDDQDIVVYADLLDDLLHIENCLNEKIPAGKWEVINSLFLFQPPDPDLEDIWYKVIKDQETERWMHTVHHELDDKTPEEILKEDQGRERILAMLDSFIAKASGNEHSEDLINYMRERINQ